MKIITNSYDAIDYSEFSVEIDGKVVFTVGNSHDDPSSNTLADSFNDCYKIAELLKLAFEAGKRGEELEISNFTNN